MVQLNFNAHQVAPNVGPDPVPSGIYVAMITKSEEVPVSGKPGNSFIRLSETIQEGEHKGKVLQDRLNIKNENAQAVDIAYSTLSAICYVTGKMVIASTEELHNIPFKINVVKLPRNDDPTRETNEVRGYMDMAGNPPNKAGAAVTVAPSVAAAQAAAFQQQPAAVVQTAAAVTAQPVTAAAETWAPMPNNAGFEWMLVNGVPNGQVRPVQAAVVQQQQAAAPAPVVQPTWQPGVPYQDAAGIWMLNGAPLGQQTAAPATPAGNMPSWAT